MIQGVPHFIALALFLIQNPAVPQPAGKTPSSSEQAKQNPTVHEDDSASQRREQRLLLVRNLVARVSEFKLLEDKIPALIGLADALWKTDEPYARQIFLYALDSTSVAKEPDKDERSTKPLMRKLPPDERAAWYRRKIIVAIAQHDVNWARRLLEASTNASKGGIDSNTSLAAASALVESQPDEALKLAENVLRSRVPKEMFDFLFRMRAKDPKAADDLLLKALNNLVAQPYADINDLMLLGTYVLTESSADFPPHASNRRYTMVANQTVLDISSPRSDVSPEILRAYLEAAITILSRPVSDPQQMQLYYMAAYQILPLAQRFLPDRATQLSESMQALAPQIPSALTQPSNYNNLAQRRSERASDPDLGESILEIEKLPDLNLREARYLGLTYSLWRQGKFDRAQEVAAKIKDSLASAQLSTLIKFGEASKELEKGNLESAERMIREMKPGSERAILWLGLAHERSLKGLKDLATQAIYAALSEAENVKDPRHPYLILAAASEFARADQSPLAFQVLLESVRTFNAMEGESFSQIKWSQHVEAGIFWRDFRVSLKGVQFTFAYLLVPLIEADPHATTSSILALKSEELLADAGVSLAALLTK